MGSPRYSNYETGGKNEGMYQKQNNFRIMMKEMRQKLTQSKNIDLKAKAGIVESAIQDLPKQKGKGKTQILKELDKQL